MQPAQQQGLRFPSISSARVLSIRRLLVSTFLADRIQQINSLRASGVIPSHASRAAGEEMRVFRKSVGALCTATATCLSAGRILFLVIRLLYQILIKISNALMIFAITPENFSVAYWHRQV